mgnify:CR=1 FL=1
MIRNPIYNAVGTIDCELDHPAHGWIPYTASADDSDESCRAIYQLLVDGQFGEISPYVEHEPAHLTLEQVRSLRRAAYVAESDPLKNEADYDGTGHEAWRAAVAAIKARYPLPG